MNVVENPVPKVRKCGCKGIRSCRICETKLTSDMTNIDSAAVDTFQYCPYCSKVWKVDRNAQLLAAESEIEQGSTTLCSATPHGLEEHRIVGKSKGSHAYPSSCALKSFEGSEAEKAAYLPSRVCCHSKTASEIKFDGIILIEDFVSQEEESFLDDAISQTTFVNSQSGRRKQDFGPKVNFKRQKVKIANFTGLPSYSYFLYERLQKHPCLRDFEPVELCNLEYDCVRGAHIDPHFDDSWLWGERLVTLNLLSDSILTFTQDTNPQIKIQVPLLRRSLIVVFHTARHEWKHGIEREDIGGRRIAMTFRELSNEFKSGGGREKDGTELLELALTFQGQAMVS